MAAKIMEVNLKKIIDSHGVNLKKKVLWYHPYFDTQWTLPQKI